MIVPFLVTGPLNCSKGTLVHSNYSSLQSLA